MRSCGPSTHILGAPTSVIVISRRPSKPASSAAWNWRRQCARKAGSVAQPVWSKARLAAAIASSASASDASGAWPMTAPVAGLTIGNVA